MAITSTVYKYERPKSLDDSNYEEFEYLLAWYGRDGSYHQYMFYDREESNNINTQILNIQDEDNIQSLIESEDRIITLTAENINYTDYQAMLSILVAPKIIRVYTDGTTERVSIISKSTSIRKTDIKFNIEFDITLYEKPLAK